MKTITKKKDFIYIVYDEELLKKIYTSIQCNIILCLILVLYTSESYNNYINYIYIHVISNIKKGG